MENKKLSNYKFECQSGYGVFSVGWKEKEQMIEYIQMQEEHHKKRTFKEEYFSLMKKFEIEFKNEYMFDFM